jgi:small subunit ribosomal protein S7e
MADKKIAKRQGQSTSGDTPDSIARALYDLENNVPELKKDLKPLQITDAKEVCVRVSFFFYIFMA